MQLQRVLLKCTEEVFPGFTYGKLLEMPDKDLLAKIRGKGKAELNKINSDLSIATRRYESLLMIEAARRLVSSLYKQPVISPELLATMNRWEREDEDLPPLDFGDLIGPGGMVKYTDFEEVEVDYPASGAETVLYDGYDGEYLQRCEAEPEIEAEIGTDAETEGHVFPGYSEEIISQRGSDFFRPAILSFCLGELDFEDLITLFETGECMAVGLDYDKEDDCDSIACTDATRVEDGQSLSDYLLNSPAHGKFFIEACSYLALTHRYSVDQYLLNIGEILFDLSPQGQWNRYVKPQ
jgi:hypothetical protein